MGATEQFSWFQSDKKTDTDTKDSDTTTGPKFVNAPIPRPVKTASLENGHDRAGEADHPRVLPDTLFKELLADKPKHETAPLPIPVEQGPPPAARAERPIYEVMHEEHARQSDNESKAEASTESDEDEEEDEDEESSEATIQSKSEAVAVPLDAEAEGTIPTREVTAEAVERLIERLDAEAAAEDGVAPVEPARAAAPEGPFMPLESEPEPGTEKEMPEPVTAAAAGGGGGTRPPFPPAASGGAGFGAERPSEPVPSPYDAYGYRPSFTESPSRFAEAVASPMDYAAEQAQRRAIEKAERQAFRKAAVATAIVTWVTAKYLAGQKQKRFEAAADQRIQQANDQVAELQSTNMRLQQQIDSTPSLGRYNQQPLMPTTHFEQPLYPQQPLQEGAASVNTYQPPVFAGQYEQPLQQRFEQPMTGGVVAGVPRAETSATSRVGGSLQERAPQAAVPQAAEQMPQVVGEDGQQVVLEPGQRLERRGWYSVVVDEHGREVPGAIQYGEAFRRDQRQEQTPVALADTDSKGTSQQDAAHGGAVGGGYLGSGQTAAGTGMLGSGQADSDHTLPSGQVDIDHRLSKRQNPVVATLANPVLWLAFALLVIAYFIAALI